MAPVGLGPGLCDFREHLVPGSPVAEKTTLLGNLVNRGNGSPPEGIRLCVTLLHCGSSEEESGPRPLYRGSQNLIHPLGSPMGTKQRTERENQILVAAGFKSTDEKDGLWTKDGAYWFGRNAALQSAQRTLRAGTGREVFDEEAT